MSILILRHIPRSAPSLFQVSRADGKATEPRAVPPAGGFPVEGRPASDLSAELRWYLEDFLGYPFSPETEHAERVLAALDRWGREAFGALFGDRDGGGKLELAVREGYASLRLQIRSDDPAVLAWPWEALHDPQAGPLGQVSQVERRLDAIGDPPALDPRLPRQRLHILLVTARPYARDVAYRSISRPLVELIADRQLPAEIHLLRPPTFDRLREHLRERPHHYHILHFDGHGAYGVTADAAGGLASTGRAHTFAAPQGCLVFEDEKGGPAEVSAGALAPLLREMAVPVVVLNACQSGMVDSAAQNAFASVGAALLQSGTRGVVAMAYSLYVSGAQEFLPGFYRRLFEAGSVAEAVRAGRQAMLARPGRVCARGRFPLSDWLVPVLYQHEDVDLAFAHEAEGGESVRSEERPDLELGGDPGPHGFVGRDGAVLELERALRRRPAVILVHGLGGVGKTTLARGFVEWLRDTGGLGGGCLWFSFQEIRTAEYVLNRLGEALFGTNFAALGRQEKLAALAQQLRRERLILVWDNFEVVAGIPGTPLAAALSPEDRTDLRDLLHALSGGATKVIVTSRGEEGWLGEDRFKVPLGGLQGEERWEYCGRILDDLGLSVDRDDADLAYLLDMLDGHPLMMRVVLRELERRTASEMIAALRAHGLRRGSGKSEAEERLFATLRFVEDSLPLELRPLLVPLAFHERFVDGDYLQLIAQTVDAAWPRERTDTLLGDLATAGLLHDRGQAVFEMHPALTGFLRATVLPRATMEERDAWARAFVSFMAAFADDLAPRPLHEQRVPFYIHGASFRLALAEAERLAMLVEQCALLQAFGAHAQNTRRWEEASAHFKVLAEVAGKLSDEPGESAAYHQLGMIAQQQRDLDAAESWYRQSLEIKVRLADERGAAITYHQLGNVAEEQRDFDAAERWYRKSQEIEERLGNQRGAALTYHQLGMVAQEQRDFGVAERWYRKALEIMERLGNEHDAALTYHQLGIVAQEQHHFGAAESWYRKSLEIKEGRGDEYGAASTYHQLGTVAQMQRDLNAAERSYRKSLEITERLGEERGAAMTYHQLGMVAQEQHDFDAAERWYRKSLEIKERLDDEHGAASTYGDLGIVAGRQRRFEESARWLVRSIQGFQHTADSEGSERNTRNFLIFFRQAGPPEREAMRRIWLDAGLTELPWDEAE
ncbi:MAG TPA: tetratricopeptide repeat protein [Thermoanaerobaculia bacterium]|jgi:tetratricopeptide (TPR) repeat protein|nr:tetratricopeptide repeat protein [Thermoanaerobaculia bacterium]